MPQPPKPPPIPSGMQVPDLGALKHQAPPNHANHMTAVMQGLSQLGLRCQCGNPIQDEGIQAMIINEPEPGAVGIAALSLCSRDCEVAQKIIPEAFCIRTIPPIEWNREVLDRNLGIDPNTPAEG